jgi:hypothetical protein
MGGYFDGCGEVGMANLCDIKTFQDMGLQGIWQICLMHMLLLVSMPCLVS